MPRPMMDPRMGMPPHMRGMVVSHPHPAHAGGHMMPYGHGHGYHPRPPAMAPGAEHPAATVPPGPAGWGHMPHLARSPGYMPELAGAAGMAGAGAAARPPLPHPDVYADGVDGVLAKLITVVSAQLRQFSWLAPYLEDTLKLRRLVEQVDGNQEMIRMGKVSKFGILLCPCCLQVRPPSLCAAAWFGLACLLHVVCMWLPGSRRGRSGGVRRRKSTRRARTSTSASGTALARRFARVRVRVCVCAPSKLASMPQRNACPLVHGWCLHRL